MPSTYKLKSSKIGTHFSPGPILTSIDELEQDGVMSETVLRVAGARVLYVNYELLQHDFPQLKYEVLEKEFPGLKSLKGNKKHQAIRNKIDEWLVRHTAFISKNQARQSTVNTPIATGNEQVQAYRPPGYGRALVFSLEETDKGLLLGDDREKPAVENRLLDVKGCGIAPNKQPVNESHSNGIYQLGYALIELVIGELLQRIFRHSKTAIQTLPVYGIIDLGFDELNEHMETRPTGLMIRRAHRRPKDSGGLYPYNADGQHVQLAIEQLLRKYGITSANSVTKIKVWKENGQLQIQYGDQKVDFFNQAQKAEIEKVSHYADGMDVLTFDGINIQHTREISLHPTVATLVDFQSYSIRETFNDPLLSLVSDKLLRWGGTIWPGYKAYVKPVPELQIPFNLLAAPGSIWGYNLGEEKKKINSLCYGLAADFRAHNMSREMVLATLQTYLDALTASWPK